MKATVETVEKISLIEDLLHDERKRKFLTPEEKKRLKEYAEERRIKNKNKKK